MEQKNNKKKIAAIALISLLAFAGVGTALALTNNPIKDYVIDKFDTGTLANKPDTVGLDYSVNDTDKTASVIGIGTAYDQEIVKIPKSVRINGQTYAVTSIGNANLESGNGKYLYIPETVKNYSGGAIFANGTDFSNSSFEVIEFAPNAGFGELQTYTGKDLYAGSKSLRKVILPNGLTAIGSFWRFSNCKSLEEVKIPSTVTALTSASFDNCSSLREFEIPATVTTLGNYVFEGCTSLEKGEIPNTVTAIGFGVYQGDTSLKSAKIPSNTTAIPSYFFEGCVSLESFAIPETVTTIGDYAFYNCKKINSAVLPNAVTSLGQYAYAGCSKLSDFKSGTGLTAAGASAFIDDWNLRTAEFDGTALATVGADAFRHCYNLVIFTNNATEAIFTLVNNPEQREVYAKDEWHLVDGKPIVGQPAAVSISSAPASTTVVTSSASSVSSH